LTDQIPTSPEHFTAFLSVREEAGRAEEHWENEGGHMSATQGRIISTPDGFRTRSSSPSRKRGHRTALRINARCRGRNTRARLREAPYGTATRRTRER